jgi:uncharacterized protein YifN (PemK superfamily)
MTPEAGDVLSYAYLWAWEAKSGKEEGMKDRPSVVVVSHSVHNNQLQLLVAPITHSPPHHIDQAIEIPLKVKRNLGLDSERSWIVTSELNRFIWPGPDIRLIRGKTGLSPLYGAIPEKLFNKVKEQFLAKAKLGKIGIVKRTE